jgi:hypothetical protein
MRLEPVERHVLKDAMVLSTFYPRTPHERQAAVRLAEGDYLRVVRRASEARGMPPPTDGYEITSLGRQALSR